MSIRIAANISFMFAEVPMSERFGLANLYGFSSVEIQFPFEHDAVELRRLADRAHVEVELINIPANDFLDGGEGLAAVPGREQEFQGALQMAIRYATTLGATRVNVLPGRCHNVSCRDDYLATYKKNLRFAADLFAEHQITCLFEAINTHDMPGFLIHSHEQQLQVIHELRHPNLFAQADIYHIARDVGPERIADALAQVLPVTRHIQFADYPARGEPGTGNIEFLPVLKQIYDSGYEGVVAAEYKPTKNSPLTLDWLPSFRDTLAGQ